MSGMATGGITSPNIWGGAPVDTTQDVGSVPFRCPVCLGTCSVNNGFYMPLMNNTVYYGNVPCRSCKGEGIVWSKA